MQGKWSNRQAAASEPSRLLPTARLPAQIEERALGRERDATRSSLQGPLKRGGASRGHGRRGASQALDFGFAYGDYWIIEVGDAYEYRESVGTRLATIWSRARRRCPGHARRRARAGPSTRFSVGILSCTEQ